MAKQVSAEHPPVCDYEGSDYQTAFWEHGDRAYEDQVEALALRRLLPKRGKLLLELGAGAGRNTPRYHGYERIVLLDYSRTQLEQAQKRLGISERYIYVAADIYRLPFASGLFPAATMIRVLHHMLDPGLALKQVRRIITPGGTFILEYANKQNLKAILRYFAGRQAWNPFSREAVEFAELNFDFHPKAVRKWLGEAGFAVQRQLTVSHFRIGWVKRVVPLKLLVWMDGAAQWSGSLWQLTPSVFLRAEAVGETPSNISAGEFGVGSLFCCPECGSLELVEVHEALNCTGCGQRWSTRDGIYDFRRPIE